MAINFTGLPPNSQTTGTRSKTDNEPVGGQSPQQSETQKAGGGHADEVRLSDSIQALQAADKRLADTPAVDESRVEALRNAIESGSYQIDYQRVAQRMLDFEQSLD
ncbi:flagellar biosynthesis anti-sigma factor FlgM [Marinobacterium aestuariivivens]|uniref:Negative regulator of flagellin synthesis n=1 Tax=Marinobacterium aestuariivivens TaxID=1698799 RepID=A0ABW1ZX92_9GAMM